jgi:UDP-N-acetylmuramoyl-tripeptide--D-alanyl-D-alanine ligase
MEIDELHGLFLKSSGVSTDTRKIEPNSIFFALKGENFNGNKFAEQAIDSGASYSIVDEHEFDSSDKTILVDNVLNTLQLLANYHRKQFNIPFIGITGTNGKTTSKELIYSVLSKEFRTSCTQGNLNNHIGVPLTLLSIKEDCEIAIIEMGANKPKDILELCEIAEPNFGIITNIGTAHIEGFGSKEGVINTKNEMYEYISKADGLLFTNKDDQLLQNLSSGTETYTYGTSEADLTAHLYKESPTLVLEWNNQFINSTLYGAYNFYNILLAMCIGQYFKMSEHKIISGIEKYQSNNNRSQLIQLDGQNIYLDAYNANPSSMNVAIDSFSKIETPSKLMILGDMLELGDISKNEHQAIMDKANKLNISAYFVGSIFSQCQDKHKFKCFDNADDLIHYIENKPIVETNLLIKGSRGIKLETVAEHIQKKGA